MMATRKPEPVKLTPREVEVLTWMARGSTYREAGVLLDIREDTAKAHVESACQKLKAQNKTHAVAIAITLGLIELD